MAVTEEGGTTVPPPAVVPPAPKGGDTPPSDVAAPDEERGEMKANVAAPTRSFPWSSQLSQTGPESWTAGRGMLTFTTIIIIWYASLAYRFTSGEEAIAAWLWLLALVLWLVIQTKIARAHLPERLAFMFFTGFQAVTPTVVTVVLALTLPTFRGAIVSIATDATVVELVAIHILRLAAWGTIAKYLKGQLPRYFFRFGSIPDFGFAILAVMLTSWHLLSNGTAADYVLVIYSILGAAAFLGAATTMFFGIPGSPISWRWSRVAKNIEAPTFLPHRWPMNLAPAFCGSAFWLAHGLLLVKVWMT